MQCRHACPGDDGICLSLGMIILIAESKTMSECARSIGGANLSKPVFETRAAAIMERLCEMPASEIARRGKLSPAMASRARLMALDFPDKSTGAKAAEAFTGVVFKALRYESLDASAKRFAGSNLRIVSSLYGWLRPDDIVKPYRLDFTMPLAPGDITFAAWWRDALTRRLSDELHASGCRDVLDLMPADAARCFNLKALGSDIRVWKADFRAVEGATVKSPHATRLKTLRGLLLHRILSEQIESPEALMTIESDDFIAEGTDPASPRHIIFTTA